MSFTGGTNLYSLIHTFQINKAEEQRRWTLSLHDKCIMVPVHYLKLPESAYKEAGNKLYHNELSKSEHKYHTATSASKQYYDYDIVTSSENVS